MEDAGQKLALFHTDEGITMAFGERAYFIGGADPFYNIAKKALEQGDHVPFYVEMAKREGLGEEFRDALMREVERLGGDGEPD
mgnify:CR=1 FL=1